jgi:hypothetical protein
MNRELPRKPAGDYHSRFASVTEAVQKEADRREADFYSRLGIGRQELALATESWRQFVKDKSQLFNTGSARQSFIAGWFYNQQQRIERNEGRVN